MTSTELIPASYRSLVLPSLLLAALGGLIAVESGAIVRQPAQTSTVSGPQTVVVPARTFQYRLSGEFLRDGIPVDAPLATVAAPELEVMTYQVTTADYARCVADGACEPAEPGRRLEGDVPVTGVNFSDGVAYAAWLSARTGETWRLPTEAEWVHAAADRFADDALGLAGDGTNPADRWIANYEREAALGLGAVTEPMPPGHFGANAFGVADLAGSVWEWTTTCNSRTRLDANGNVLSRVESCGVRILEGRHRSAMSTFVRDGRGGACAVGRPPDNLGLRLVKEPRWYAPLVRLVQGFAR